MSNQRSARTETRRTDYGQTGTWRPPSPTSTCTRCGGFYVDDEPGRGAHRVVFAHTPTTEREQS